MVGIPQGSDQPTNAKFVENVWRVGVRAANDEEGNVRRQELEMCIRVFVVGEESRDPEKCCKMEGEGQESC